MAFVLASSAPPFIGMVETGVRALHEPIKFGLAWVPLLIAAWAAVCMTAYATAFSLAFLLRGRQPQEARSQELSAAVGLAAGLTFVFIPNLALWGLVAVVALGPVLFRTWSAQGLDEQACSGVDAAQLHAAADEPRPTQP